MQYRIIGLGITPWRGAWMNRQHLLSRLAADKPAMYSNGPLYVWDIRSGKFPLRAGGIARENHVLIDLCPSFVPRWPRLPKYDDLAMAFHSRRWLRLLGSDQLPLVAIVFDPGFYPFLRHLNPEVSVYHAYDLFEGMPGWSAGLENLEDALLRCADIRTASSEVTCQRLGQRSGRHVTWLPNGVEVGLFEEVAGNNQPEPADIAAIPRPRLGWIGSLHTGLDFRLVAKLARARPNYHFVFVGPGPAYLSDAASTDYRALTSYPNVHFLPSRSRREAVQSMFAMDVNLMLYKIEDDSWTKAGQPLKLFEYLAVGRPIISTPMPAVLPYADSELVAIATDATDWLRAMDSAISGEPTDVSRRRKQVAAGNDWNVRAQRLDDLICEALGARTNSATP